MKCFDGSEFMLEIFIFLINIWLQSFTIFQIFLYMKLP